MTEINTKSLVVNIGGKQYVMTGSRLEDICDELGVTVDRFIELLSRDAYCPTLNSAPTLSTLTYIDVDGSENHFQTGQPCRWSEGGVWKMAFLKDNTEGVAQWLMVPMESDLDGYIPLSRDFNDDFNDSFAR